MHADSSAAVDLRITIINVPERGQCQREELSEGTRRVLTSRFVEGLEASGCRPNAIHAESCLSIAKLSHKPQQTTSRRITCPWKLVPACRFSPGS